MTAEIARAFPDAPVYAILGRASVAARMGIGDRVTALLPERERLLRTYRSLAPAYPLLVRSARLPPADVVVASSYAYAHGFRSVNGAPVVCYCHGPFRHLWSQQAQYAAQLPGGGPARAAFAAYCAMARTADRAAARSVDSFCTQSPFTASLIEQVYGRRAELVPPAIDGAVFRPARSEPEPYFLFVGRLVEAYKRPSLVVDAFAQMPDLRLRIAGDGPAFASLRRRASPNVEFLGRLEDGALAAEMQNCQAAIFPSADDFGLVPLEVNACGRPVLALARGGARHTVKPGLSGEFLEDQTAAAIVAAVRRFDPARYHPDAVRRHALTRDTQTFHQRIRDAARRAAERAALVS